MCDIMENTEVFCMIRIAVVDDEQEQIDLIYEIISDFFNERKIKILIKTFMSGESLLSETVEYDLIFLDIQMSGIDGIETAQRLRTINKKVVLFYITSYQDYIQRSMTIHPFAFIVKPYTETEVKKNLEDYLAYEKSLHQKKANELYQINTIDDHHFNINMNDILYFHYMDNRIIDVITKAGNYKIKDGIMHIYPKLNHEYFIIPNQSFIVNLNYIKEIDGKNKTMVMENGDLLLISRRKYNDVIETLNFFISNQGER